MVMWTVLSYGDGYMDIYVLLIVTYFAVFWEWGYFIVNGYFMVILVKKIVL